MPTLPERTRRAAAFLVLFASTLPAAAAQANPSQDDTTNVVVGVLSAGLLAWAVVWVYRDAKRRSSRSPAMWAAATLLTSFLALLVWLWVRPRSTAAPPPPPPTHVAKAHAPRPASVHLTEATAAEREAWRRRLVAGEPSLMLAPPPALKLEPGETLVACADGISLMEGRAVSVTKEGHGSTSLHAGIFAVDGGTRSQASFSAAELALADAGKLLLTTRRLVFIGRHRNLHVPVGDIASVDGAPDGDGVRVAREGREDNYVFLGFNGLEAAVDGAGRRERWVGFGWFSLLQHLVGGAAERTPPA